METLKDIKEQLEVTTENTPAGIVTTIRHPTGISYRSQVRGPEHTLLAAHLDAPDQTFKVTYLYVDRDGKLSKALHETAGLLPKFFPSSTGETWCLLVDRSTEKELEIIVPVLNRQSYDKPKGRRHFLGELVGRAGELAVFHDADILSNQKPDKLLKVEIRDGKARPKTGKLPLPAKNRVFIDENGQLQLLAWQSGSLVHRVSDIDGNVTHERTIQSGRFATFQVLHLDFNGESRVLLSNGAQILVATFRDEGQLESEVLFDNSNDIFSMWPPVRLKNGASILRFTHERGNGWLIIKGTELVEGFICDAGGGYRSVVSDAPLPLPKADLILAGVSATGSSTYCVTTYPRTKQNDYTELFTAQMEVP